MAGAQEHYDEGLRNLCKSHGNKSAMWYGQAAREFTAAIEAAPNLTKAYAQRALCFAGRRAAQHAR